MTCACRSRAEEIAERSRREAEKEEAEARSRLESFREGIAEGAREVASRHLFRAGVYLASLDGGIARQVSPLEVQRSLRNRLDSMDPEVSQFCRSNGSAIEEQARYVEPEGMLRRIVRQREKAESLLKASAERELQQAKAALERLRILDDRLKTWREGVRFQGRVATVQIADPHS